MQFYTNQNSNSVIQNVDSSNLPQKLLLQHEKADKIQEKINVIIEQIKNSKTTEQRALLLFQLSSKCKKLEKLKENASLEIKSKIECVLINSKSFISRISSSETKTEVTGPKETDQPNIEIKKGFPSWLTTIGGVNEELLSHIVGDIFSSASDTEGSQSKTIFAFFLEYLKQKPQTLNEDQWMELQIKIEKGRDLIEIVNGQLSINEKVFCLQQEITSSFDKNEPIILNGGWTGSPSGHAIYYLIIPETDKTKCKIRLYNRGAGIQYHQTMISKEAGKPYHPGYLEIENIPSDRVTDKEWLKAIIELNTRTLNIDNKTQTRYGEEDIYVSLMGFLEGSPKKMDLQMEDLLSEQKGGTCAWKSFSALLCDLLGKSTYKQLKLELEFITAWSYFNLHKNELSKRPDCIKLLQNTVTELTFSIEDKLAQQQISQEDYQKCLNVIQEIDKETQKANIQWTKDREAKSQSYPIPKTTQELSSLSSNLVGAKLDEPEQESLSMCSSSDFHHDDVKMPDFEKVSKIYEWNVTAGALNHDMQSFLAICHEANQRGEYATSHYLYQEIIRRLPLPLLEGQSIQPDFWSIFTKDSKEVSVFITVLGKLFDEYFESCLYVGSPSLSLERNYAVLKSLHIQSLLCDFSSEFNGMSFGYENYFESEWVTPEIIQILLSTPDFQISSELIQIQKQQQILKEINKPQFFIHEFLWRNENEIGINKIPYLSQQFKPNFINALSDLPFITDWLKDAAHFEDVKKKYIETSQTDPKKLKETLGDINNSFEVLPLHLQITFILCFCTDLLPKNYTLLMNQAYKAKHLLYTFFQPLPWNHQLSEKNLKVQPRVFKITTSSLGKCPEVYYDIPAMEYTKVDSWDWHYWINYFRHFPQIKKDSFAYNLLMCYIYLGPQDISKNVFAQPFSDLEQYSHQEVRQVISLLTNRELLIEQTLSYFLKNTYKILDPDFRILLMTFLFTEDLLVKEIKQNPQCITHLKQLIKSGLNFSLQTKNIEAYLFMCALSRNLNEYLHSIPEFSQEKLLDQSPEEIIKALLAMPNLKNEEKSLVWTEWMIICAKKQSLTPNEMKLLIEAKIHLKAYPFVIGKLSPEDEELINKCWFKHFAAIGKFAKSNPQILSEIQAKFPLFAQGNWKEHVFPVFTSSHGATINLYTGERFHPLSSEQYIPKEIKQHPYFIALFGSRKIQGKIVGFNTYQCEDENKQKYFIKYENQQNELVIQRQVGKILYTWVPPNLLTENKSLKKGLTLSYHFWKASTNEAQWLMSNKNGSWVGMNHQQQFVLFNKNGPEKKLVALESLSESWQFLKQFEGEKEFIGLWSSHDKDPDLIELPRYSLSFELNQEKTDRIIWKCREYPDFSLSSVQCLRDFPNIPHIVLENINGERKVILPCKTLSISPGATFTKAINYYEAPKDNSREYVVFDVKKHKTSGKDNYIAQTPLANLQLAYYYISQGSYDRTRELLQWHHYPLQADFTKEIALLEEFFKLPSLNKDNTSSALGMRLQAAALYFELIERSSQKENVRLQTNLAMRNIEIDAQKYCKVYRKLGTYRMPHYKEKRLFARLAKYSSSSIIHSMYQSLDPNFHPPAQPSQEGKHKPIAEASQKEIKEWFTRKWMGNPIQFVIDYFYEPYQPCKFLITRPGEQGLSFLIANILQEKDSVQKEKHIEIAKKCLSLSQFEPASGHSKYLRYILKQLVDYPDLQIPPLPKKKNWKEALRWFQDEFCSIIQQPIKSSKKFDSSYLSNSIVSRKTIKPYNDYRMEKFLANKRTAPPIAPGDKVNIDWNREIFHPSDFLISSQLSPQKKLGEKIQQQIEVLSSINVNRSYHNESQRIKKDVSAHLEQTEKDLLKQHHQSISSKKLVDLQDKLEKEIECLNREMMAYEQQLMNWVNLSSEKSPDPDMQRYWLKQKENLSLDTLLIFYGSNQLNELGEMLPHLKDHLPLLKKTIENYLKKGTAKQHLMRIREKTEDCCQSIKENQQVSEGKLNALVQEIQSKRCYKSSQRPECLIFEFLSNIHMRPAQIKMLDEFLNHANAEPIMQMIMGMGKTSVLMPLLALWQANGKQLSILMVPETMFASVSEEIREKLGSSFEKMVYPFIFTRESKIDVDSLQEIKEKLLHVKSNKECLITTPKDIHSFYLKFIETWKAMSQANEEEFTALSIQFELMRDILSIFKNESSVLIDEVDLILSCRMEVNFPVGLTKSMTERDMDLLIEIYDILLSPSFKAEIRFEFDPLPNANASIGSKDNFNKKIKPKFAKELIKRFKQSQFLSDAIAQKVKAFLSEQENEKLLLEYFYPTKSFRERLEVNQVIENLADEDLRNLFILSKEEIATLLPMTIQRNCDEDYGIDQELFSTVFENGKPLPGTRFSDPFETGNCTLQSYIKHGVPLSVIQKQIDNWKSQALEKIKLGQNLEDSTPYREFYDLVGNDPKYNLLNFSSQDLHSIKYLIDNNTKLKKNFLKKYILISIQSHTQKVNSNALMLVHLFSRVNGFTGTLWNADTYSDRLKSCPDIGTDAKTIVRLMEMQKGKQNLWEAPTISSEKLLTTIPFEQNDLALIDAGAYFKDIPVEKTASILLEHFVNTQPEIKGVVFFDANNRKMILEAGAKNPIPLAQSQLKPNQRFTFYPKPFTTGADIPQDLLAKGFMSIGRNMILRDLLQSVWRMRKIDQSQEIKWIISQEVKETIQEIIGSKEEITFNDILTFAIYNQAMQIGDDNFTSLKQKMLFCIQSEFFNIVMDQKVSPELAKKILTPEVEKLFIPASGVSPTDLYSGVEYQEKAGDVLEQEIQRHLDLLNEAFDSIKEVKLLDKQKIEKEIKKQKKLDKVNETLTYRTHEMGMNSQMQIQTKKQTKTQVQQRNTSLDESVGRASWEYTPWPTNLTPEELHSSKFIDKYSQNVPASPSLRSIDEFLNQRPELAPISKIVSKQLLVTSNLFPEIESSRKLKAIPYKRQKPLRHALIFFDPQTPEKSQLLFLDPDEAAHFKNFLLNERADSFQKDQQLVSLMNIDLDIIQKGALSPTKDQIANPEFQSLLVQAKFLAGHIYYTLGERALLRQWLKGQKIEEIKNIFNDEILPYSSLDAEEARLKAQEFESFWSELSLR